MVEMDATGDGALEGDIRDMIRELKLPAAGGRSAGSAKAKKAAKKAAEMQSKAEAKREARAKAKAARGEAPVKGDEKKKKKKEKEDESAAAKKKKKGKQGKDKKMAPAKKEPEEEEEEEEEQQEQQRAGAGKAFENSKHITFEDSDDDGSPVEMEMEEAPGVVAEAEAGEPWHAIELPSLATLSGEVSHKDRPDPGKVASLRARGEKLLAQKEQEALQESNAELNWMRSVIRSGTLSDKVAAMALMVSNNPAGNMTTLDNLVAMASKKGRREATLSIEALTDLFVNTLLPERPLVGFNANVEQLAPEGLDKVTDAHVETWMLEGEVKAKYLQFVRALETWSFDTLEHSKRLAVTTAYKLLRDKPEQEQMLLMLIVNKLGDTERKIASHVVYLLTELLQAHPNMRLVVAKEVEQFIFRKNTNERGIYYGIISLNQLVLQRGQDEELARKLIDVYLQLFQTVVRMDGGKSLSSVPEEDKKVSGKKAGNKKRKRKGGPKVVLKAAPISTETVKSRLVSAILTGVNRAFPYAGDLGSRFDDQVDVLFEMTHVGTFTTATQALLLLFHIMVSRKTVSDRFYRALYGKLQSPELRTTSRQTMFLNVVFRAIKHDNNLPRMRAFLKRLLQVCLQATAGLAAGALILVSGILQAHPRLVTMVVDADSEEKKAAEKAVTKAAADDEDDEDLEDVLGKSDTPTPSLHIEMGDESEEGKTRAEEVASKPVAATYVDDAAEGPYDPMARDPRFAKCDGTSKLWELQCFLRHFHPSVRTIAQSMIEKPREVAYKGDPIRDFSNLAFLDRFVYRNPRQRDIEKLKGAGTFGHHGRVARMGRKVALAPVNSAKFLLKDATRVGADERFFHEFFHKKAESEGRDLRSELAEKLLQGKDGKESDDPFLNDEEDKMDEFATKLAEDMMRQAHGDPDLDDADIDLGELDYENEEDDRRALVGVDESELFGDNDSDSDGPEPVMDGDDSGDGESDDDELDLDSDDGDDQVLGEGGSDSDSDAGADGAKSTFADADEIAHLLENAGTDKRGKKERQWEDRIEKSKFGDMRRRAKQGNNKKQRRR